MNVSFYDDFYERRHLYLAVHELLFYRCVITFFYIIAEYIVKIAVSA